MLSNKTQINKFPIYCSFFIRVPRYIDTACPCQSHVIIDLSNDYTSVYRSVEKGITKTATTSSGQRC